MNPFSCSIDIKRFQNLLETSANENERRKIQEPAEKKTKLTPPAAKQD